MDSVGARGEEKKQTSMVMLLSPEQVVPARHPIRQVKRIADAVLATELRWDYTTFSRNRQRLLEHDVASKFFYAVVEQAQRAQLTSSDHFTVDGTLIDAWASLKSFKSKERSHALTENRNGLLIDFRVDSADGRAECRNALVMLARASPGSRRATVGADKGYDNRGFVAHCRKIGVTPHVAQNVISQRIRQCVEEIFGWGKTVGGLHNLHHPHFSSPC